MMKTDYIFENYEPVKIVSYDFHWPVLYIEESKKIKELFSGNRIVSIEHYGSTSVPSMEAKPIVDILIGLSQFFISQEENKKLKVFGYEYIGLSISSKRFFLRKRVQGSYNLAVVEYGSKEWLDNLAIRDYLRVHKDKALEYAQLKHKIVKEETDNPWFFGQYKSSYIEELVGIARRWKEGRK